MNGGLMRVFKNKKTGFSLMELAISVMIVALLVVIIVPIVQNQLSKSDEYAYYMAYRSVEKLGGQIVALGDPENELYKAQLDDSSKIATNLNKNTFITSLKATFSNLGSRFAYTEHFVFKNLFPRSFADSSTRDSSVSGENYDEAVLMFRVCQNGERIQNESNPTNADGTTRYYQCSELLSYSDEDPSGNSTSGSTTWSEYNKDYNIVKGLLPSNGCFLGSEYETTNSNNEKVQDSAKVNAALARLETYLVQKKSFENYCYALATYCNGTDDNDNVYEIHTELRKVEETDPEDNTTSTISYCDSYVTRSSNSSSSGSASYLPVTAPKMPNICIKAPYYGMKNANEVTTDETESQSINCICKTGSTTTNNEKVCCPVKSGYNSYAPTTVSTSARTAYNNYVASLPTNDPATIPTVAAKSDTDYCRYCRGEYNPVKDWCCPMHSVFNGTACECANGYEMEHPGTSAERCKKTKCAPGYHTDLDTEVCVPNPPIIKANRLCELIHKNWNIVEGSKACDTFTLDNDVNVYSEVLEAAKGNNGSGYLSINSKSGGFSQVKPNIILSNGLRLWILGDKAASIPGLSFNPVGITSTQNMCRELLKSDNISPLSTKTLCDAAGGYFCAGEAHCYTLDSGSLEKMGDARNCCASTDLSTIDYSTNLDKDNRAFGVGGFTVFVDINGAAKGTSTLWEDVFPFYIGTNGRVYPGYPLDAPKAKDADSNDVYLAGNSVKNIPVDVYYFLSPDSNANSRKRVVAYSNVSYARGICYAKLIGSHTPYCKNLGLKARGMGDDVDKVTEMIDSDSNPCTKHSCFVSVRNKLRFF